MQASYYISDAFGKTFYQSCKVMAAGKELERYAVYRDAYEL